MAITNGYTTRNQIKAALRIGTADTIDDDLIDNCAGAASRLIDGYCNRKFWAAGSATSRVFQAEDSFFCSVDDFSGTAITLQMPLNYLHADIMNKLLKAQLMELQQEL